MICVFVFAYAKRWFSHDAAHFSSENWPIYACKNRSMLYSRLNILRVSIVVQVCNDVGVCECGVCRCEPNTTYTGPTCSECSVSMSL